MTSRGFARFRFSIAGTFAVAGLFASPALAQDHGHGGSAPNALVKVVREINATRPEIVIYEPVGNGQVRLVGADYLVFADAWDKTHSSAPELMGQKFQQFEAPNRFGLPRFYTLHVWAWKDNPTGTFVNWHSNISCDAFSGPTQ